MPETQSYKNHTRWYPPFHFFVLPVLLLNFIFSIVETVRHWPQHRALFGWWIVLSVALFVLAATSRLSALKAQDRVIRLEEKLRMAALLSAEDLAASKRLTEAQFIALRFASDEELPKLVRRTLAENLTPQQIKESINSWRPDYFRV
jgi:hypothetical protein